MPVWISGDGSSTITTDGTRVRSDPDRELLPEHFVSPLIHSGLVFLLALIVNRVLEGSPEEELMFDG